VTLNELNQKRQIPLVGFNNNHNAGELVVDNMNIIEKPTFVEYLRSGWQINLMVAIDYTGSNGDPSSPRSLHYLGAANQYEAAIGSVGSILEVYDNDRSFPVYGFGGIPTYQGMNQVSHCFALNGNEGNPEVQGVGNLL
jgi:hypothetical protein